MTAAWLVPHWAQILIVVFGVVGIILALGNFKQ